MAITYNHKSIEQTPKTYKVGDTFLLKHNNEPHILAQVGYGEVTLISLIGGNRLAPPVEVDDITSIDLYDVVNTTLNELTPCDFILTAKED